MLTIQVRSDDREQFLDITAELRQATEKIGVEQGAIIVYVPHTTAGIVINEGADPAVAVDIQSDLERLVPWDQPYYRHREGNSPSHTRAALVGSSEIILVEDGELILGTWQSVFFCEFDGPRRRRVHLQPLGS